MFLIYPPNEHGMIDCKDLVSEALRKLMNPNPSCIQMIRCMNEVRKKTSEKKIYAIEVRARDFCEQGMKKFGDFVEKLFEPSMK